MGFVLCVPNIFGMIFMAPVAKQELITLQHHIAK